MLRVVKRMVKYKNVIPRQCIRNDDVAFVISDQDKKFVWKVATKRFWARSLRDYLRQSSSYRGLNDKEFVKNLVSKTRNIKVAGPLGLLLKMVKSAD